MPLVMVAVVAVLIGVAYLHFAKGRATASGTPASRKPAAAGSPSPDLGPWKHITTRTEDPAALTLTELFPRPVLGGGTTVVAVRPAADTTCPRMVLGTGLQTALRKAGLHPGDAGQLRVGWAEDHGHDRGTQPGRRHGGAPAGPGHRGDRVHQAATREQKAPPAT